MVQSLVDVVWSYSLWFGPTLCSPVLQSLSDLVIVGLEENVRVIYQVKAVLGSLLSGLTLCGPALQWVHSWDDAV